MPYEQAREACNRLLVELDEDIRNYIIDMLGGDESEEEMKAVVKEFLVSTEHCAEDAAMVKVKVTELFASLSAATPADPATLNAEPRILDYTMSLWRLRHAVPRHATLSKLSGDEQGIILGQLRNTLEPWHVMYFSSASKGLRALLPAAARQQLRADYKKATALCLKAGMQSCKELREATRVQWKDKGLSESDLATLATLGSVLPALEVLWLYETSGSAGPGGVLRLAEGLVAGALPTVTGLFIIGMHVGDAGASAFAAALDRGALPRLESLALAYAAIGDAALASLAPALRRRPALEGLYFCGNPFGDEGLAALVAPPPPAAGTPPAVAGGLKKLKWLYLRHTQISDAGCASLVAALDSGALPALEKLELGHTRASGAARDAAFEALARARSRARA